MNTLTFTRPDDWHVHLRDENWLETTVPHTAHAFARAIVMPNLKQPITTAALAQEYYQRIIAQISPRLIFTPLMTLYLTDQTKPADIQAAYATGLVIAAKLYPAHATTLSAYGVTDIQKLMPVFETLAQLQMPLLIHGEVTTTNIDIFDREQVFIDTILQPLLAAIPSLKIVLEHITTQQAVECVLAHEALGATITPHHLLLNRNHMLVGGIQPHHYCLPVAKRERHRLALVKAATSGHPRFFLGTDSAPHLRKTKENACGCAGIYSSHAAIPLYLKVFELEQALDKFETFASINGANFYGLPVNSSQLTVERKPWQVPMSYSIGDELLIPFMAGQTLEWQVKQGLL